MVAGGTQDEKIFELKVYDGATINTLNGTKEAFKDLFESVNFEGIEIPLVDFSESLYKMIKDSQDRYFDVISIEHLSGKSVKFKENNFDNGLISIAKDECNLDSKELILSSLMINLRKLAKTPLKESCKPKIEEAKKPKTKEVKKETNEKEKEEINTNLEKETNEVNQIKKKKTDESILNSFLDMMVMQSMMNLFNQHTKTDDEIKLEKLKDFLKKLN